jgi:phosphatidylglycerophosphate synthase
VTPNQVTLAAFVVALGAGTILLTWPGYAGLVAGIVVFELSYVLDCADGMLARWRGVQSTTGHLLDFLMDELKAFVILATVSVRLFLEHADVRFLLVGLFGLTCLASGIAITTFQRRPEIATPASATAASKERSLVKRAVGLVERGAKFLIHYPSYILFAAIAGRIEWYLFPYVAVNALYVLRALAWVTLRFGRGS